MVPIGLAGQYQQNLSQQAQARNLQSHLSSTQQIPYTHPLLGAPRYVNGVFEWVGAQKWPEQQSYIRQKQQEYENRFYMQQEREQKAYNEWAVNRQKARAASNETSKGTTETAATPDYAQDFFPGRLTNPYAHGGWWPMGQSTPTPYSGPSSMYGGGQRPYYGGGNQFGMSPYEPYYGGGNQFGMSPYGVGQRPLSLMNASYGGSGGNLGLGGMYF
jgi:hypothetical protein